MKTIYLIRHAESTGNKNKVFCGMTDCALSEEGERQLERLKDRFAEITLDAIYASPLKRARLTADAVSSGPGKPKPIIDNRIAEMSVGLWENKPWETLSADFPKEHSDWVNNPDKFQSPGGESMADVYSRTSAALTDITSKTPNGGAVVIASHGCALRNMICFALGLPLSRIPEMLFMKNSGVTKIVYDGSNKIEFFNDLSHLLPR